MSAHNAWIKPALAAGWLVVFSSAQGLAGDSLVWNTNRNQVSAEISAWPLTKFLERLGNATAWQVFMEPGTGHTVSAKFKDRAPGDALRVLLGKLSFALVPQTNGPARFFVFKTAMEEATQFVQPTADEPANGGEKGLIGNELIVTLKPGEKMDTLARKLGATIIGRSESLNAYRLKFQDEAAAKAAREHLASDSSVASVDANYRFNRPSTPDELALGSSPALHLNPRPLGGGNAIVVGLVDTAIQRGGMATDAFMLPAISVAGDTKVPQTEPTHGTSMAETILRGLNAALSEQGGTAVRILPVDVYGQSENTTTYEVALGIQAAINQGANVINLSLGGEGDSPFLRELVKSARDKGILIFAAAGNNPGTTPIYPAAYPEVVAVTAGDRKGTVASYANRGDFVDVVAPGTAMVNFHGQTYLITGTSASTAFTAGIAAGLADKTGKPLAEVEAAVRASLALGKEK